MMIRVLPKTSGTYVLLLYLKKRTSVEVGRLGAIEFQKGWYAYVGSAFGPGGLAARVGRHLKQKKKLHWHIDHLRAVSEPKQVWIQSSADALEHQWAAVLQESGGRPIQGFGSSDCRCHSHLYYFRRRPSRLFSKDKAVIRFKPQ